ncbi:MAG: DUF192 domain-containing protein [Myxococcales bacterium]|nr:DUF192 domain-containing protein [Myxococcales bacterium]
MTIAQRTHGPSWSVELAIDELERTQGLMYRNALGTHKGMLFFMPSMYPWTFYMRNTLIPLDMIFIDEDWKVVGVVANVPPLTEKLRGVKAPSRYVLELDAHEAQRNGIVQGTQLVFSRSAVIR